MQNLAAQADPIPGHFAGQQGFPPRFPVASGELTVPFEKISSCKVCLLSKTELTEIFLCYLNFFQELIVKYQICFIHILLDSQIVFPPKLPTASGTISHDQLLPGTISSATTFPGNTATTPVRYVTQNASKVGDFPQLSNSSVLPTSAGIVPPISTMGVMPSSDSVVNQHCFAPPIQSTVDGMKGSNVTGSTPLRIAAPPPVPGSFNSMSSAPVGFPSAHGAAMNYNGTPAGIAGPQMHGDIAGPPASGIYHQKPRLDPSLMPSAQVIEEDRSTRSGIFPTGYPTAEHPPLTSTEFIAQDQGVCNPKFMRSTLYIAPASSDMLKTTQLSFAVAVTPFARLHPIEVHPPIVDLGELGPVRCHRCKAYMSPFMEFQDGGRRFKCPFCLASTAVEEVYFAHLNHTGRRTDIQHRPEQFLGSYEFVATKPYCKNGLKPKEPAFIFMLDVSYSAVHCGLVSTFCRNIRNLLNHLPKESGQDKSSLRIGFATYDQTVHFYNLKNYMGQPEMLVVEDVNDVFVPLVDGFLNFLSLLTEIEKMFAETRVTETMLGPVIQAGLDALKCADRAGKLFIFHSNLPLMDAPGKLKNREDRKLLGTDKEKTILQPSNDFYCKLGEECVKGGCAVDLFLFPNSFVDIASLSPVCTITGGSLYRYQYFEIAKDSERFLADLSHDISREIVFDVVMRVRTSTGLRPTGFFGSFFMDNSTDMEMGAIDCDKTIHVEIRHDDKLPEGNAYLQTAILFTSCSGERRLRIHNLTLSVSSDFNQLYRVADLDCLTSFLFKQAEFFLRDKSPKEMREIINTRCAQILATYREKCSEQAPLGQLILPECLKLLPLFVNSIIKNDAISGANDITVDDRAYLMQIVPSLKVEDALTLLYPTVFAVSDLVIEPQSTEITLPASIRASYENLSADKAYIIYNGIMMFLWIGLKVPQDWVQDVFNSNSVTQLNVENNIIPERDNARSRALRYVIECVNRNRLRHMKLFIICQQNALEAWMKKFLVEDRTSNMPSYVDYLCNIHREIRNLLG
ncbi:unnamed protein product [Thelazia callipaeda]|uniref:Protein transport protein Sec24C n=1 Tax=Thelazia callipaeda TaxID=103827 RepID=A0A0N5CZ19_THECL|nr:unnamed protein product [Thelazia callipaeda]